MIVDIVLVGASGRGGLENVITMVSKEMEARGYVVRVIQVFNPKYVEWKNSLTRFYSLANIEYTKEVKAERMVELYSEFIKTHGSPDIILATHVPASSYLWSESLKLAGESGNVPIMSWIHGPLAVYGENYEKLLSYADAHLAISREIEDQFISLNDKAPVYLVNNPIDSEQCEVERSCGKLELLYIGRLEKEKRIDLLIEAVAQISGDWRLRVIGDGSQVKVLQEMIEKYSIKDKVEVLGWIDNPWSVVDEADLLIVPSEQEGFGVVMVEALSRGIPVLATRTEGSSDIIRENVNGWIVEVDDVYAIITVLESIQNGSVVLPSKDECKKSVEKFKKEYVVDKIERAIKIEVEKKRSINSNKKVIDLVLDYLSGIGGTECVLSMFIKYFSEEGYRVRIIQNFKFIDDTWLKDLNVEVYSLFVQDYIGFVDEEEFVIRYENVIKKFGEPNIMMATGIPYLSYLCYRLKEKVKKNITIFSWIHNPLFVFERYEDIKYADEHIAISKDIYEQLKFIDEGKKVHLIYNPVEQNKEIVKREDDEAELLYIGRLENKQKNISLLFNVLAEISGRWKLDVYGDGVDYRWLKGFSKTLDIDDNIIWHKWVRKPWDIIKKATVLVLTSRFEGFGLVTVEALSRGIPVLATNCGIAIEIIINDYNGWIVNDKAELEEKLEGIITNKIKLPPAINCIESVKRFDSNLVLNEIKEVISE